MRAVFLESVGKQGYIFGTNKVREMVGASELISASTTDWVDIALGGLQRVASASVVRVSGRALATLTGAADDPSVAAADEKMAAQDLIWCVTSRALREAPGLHLLGTSVRLAGDGVTAAEVSVLGDQLDLVRMLGTPAEARGARLPVVASCASSGGSAAGVYYQPVGEPPEPLSAVCAAKRLQNPPGRQRMKENAGHELVDPGTLEERLSGDVKWLGVVHADGNQFGKLFRDLAEASEDVDYHEVYQAVSAAVDDCTKLSLRDAAGELARLVREDGGGDGGLPLVPLIAGGDDLTALVDGRYALQFTVAYLRAFERHTAQSPALSNLATDTTGVPYLTASAGVALVKPHFPFVAAYRLCEQACASAKRLARQTTEDGCPTSAIDWHMHYDSTAGDLDRIRDDLWQSGAGYSLLRRPYVVTCGTSASVTNGRDWEHLQQLIKTVPVSAHPESPSALPASQLERLRRMLTAKKTDQAERLYKVLCQRPELKLLGQLRGSDGDEVNGRGLLTEVREVGSSDTERSTLLLDFLDLVDLRRDSRGAGATEEVSG